MNDLLDCYGALLTKKQQAICEYYYRQDLSLQEISELEDVSRSAIYDMIHRCKEELINYENILKMNASRKQRLKYYEKLEQHCDSQGKAILKKCKTMEEESYD